MVKLASDMIFIGFLFWTPFVFAKYTVCTATINSSEEIESFKRKLSPKDFTFVELTSFNGEDSLHEENNWFENACNAGVKCDVLVISGHFGGEFFGKSGLTLGLKDLNKFSCMNRCPGIMNHPKEVYLFGCNTLASKAKDHRDERSYIEVLVADGIPRVEAERRAAARYGPFGSSFKDQIERSFENVPMIYGFTSVGPSGANIKNSLEKYLNEIGNFKTHIEKVSYASKGNKAWQKNMKYYPAAIGKGLSRSNNLYYIKENTCALSDDETTTSARFDRAVRLIADDPYVYLPTVADFINKELPDDLDSEENADIQATFEWLQTQEDLKSLIFGLTKSDSVTPGIKMDLFKMTRKFRWLSAIEFRREAHSLMESFAKPPTIAGADAICSLVGEDSDLRRRIIWPSELNEYNFDTVAEFKIVKCLNFKTPDLARRALSGAIRNQSKWVTALEIFNVLEALRNLPGYEEEMVEFALHYANYKGPYQKELEKFISLFLAQKSKGRDQVERTKVALKMTANDWGPDFLLRDISNSISREPEAILLVIDYILQHQKHRRFFLDFSVADDVLLQDGLALRWDQFSEDLIPGLAHAFRATKRIGSKALQTKIINSIPQHKDSEDTEYAYSLFLTPLAQSHLDEDNLKRLQSWLDNNVSFDQFGLHPVVRYVLFKQAQAGRWTMTEDLKTGLKSYWECDSFGTASECRSIQVK